MDATQAQALLGLPQQFDHLVLDAAYRRAASVARAVPRDRQEQLLRDLNAARETLLLALGPRPGTDLVRWRSGGPVALPAISGEEAERRVAAAGKVVQTVAMQHVGRLARLKQRRFTLGLLLSGLSLVGLLIRFTLDFNGKRLEDGGTRYPFISPNVVALVTVGLAALSAFFWILGWAVRSRERYVEMQIDRLAETLTDRATIADLLEEVGVEKLWTRADLRESVGAWITRSQVNNQPAQPIQPRPLRWHGVLAPAELEEPLWEVAERLGSTDFTGLLIAKGIETQVVEEAVIVDPDGRRRHGYGSSL